MTSYNFEVFDSFYNAHWLLTAYYRQVFSELLHYGGTKVINKVIGTMKNDVQSLIFDAKQFNKAADFYSRRLIDDNNWRKKMYAKHNYYTHQYFEAAERLRKLPFGVMADKQIVAEIKKVFPYQEWVRVLGIMMNGLVIDGRNHLSNKIGDELRRFINDDKKFNIYWLKLTQVTRLSMRQKKDIEIAKLAKLVKDRSISIKKIDEKLRKIYEKYCWLDYMYYGPPIPYSKFRNELNSAVKRNINIGLEKQLKKLADEQNRLMKKLKFNDRSRHLVSLAQYVLWQKGWRKDVEYHGLYCYEVPLREIAKRRHLKDWRNLLFLLPKEFGDFVFKKRPKSTELIERRRFSCLVADSITVKIVTGGRARNFYKKLKVNQRMPNVTEVIGQCAYKGRAQGRVRVIYVPKEMKKMNNGDILVSQATSPDLLPAIKKAAAIVTNTGGLICHAAIISRELKIPCVVGTVWATSVFKTGDLVEVDANNGIVRKLK